MCLAISNNLLLVLQDDPKRIFSPYELAYCFANLGSTATVIHNVKQRLLRNWPGCALRLLTTSCAKDYKAHSLQQTSFAESPNMLWPNLAMCIYICCGQMYMLLIFLKGVLKTAHLLQRMMAKEQIFTFYLILGSAFFSSNNNSACMHMLLLTCFFQL